MLVKKWMSKPAVTVDVDDSMRDAAALIKEHNIRMLPVLKKAYTNEKVKIPADTRQITTISELPVLIRRTCKISPSQQPTTKEQTVSIER